MYVNVYSCMTSFLNKILVLFSTKSLLYVGKNVIHIKLTIVSCCQNKQLKQMNKSDNVSVRLAALFGLYFVVCCKPSKRVSQNKRVSETGELLHFPRKDTVA